MRRRRGENNQREREIDIMREREIDVIRGRKGEREIKRRKRIG